MSAKTGTPKLCCFTAVPADNYTAPSFNSSAAAISASSAVGSPAAPTPPTEDEAGAVNYATAATFSAATIGIRFFISLVEEILHRSQSIKQRFYEGD